MGSLITLAEYPASNILPLLKAGRSKTPLTIAPNVVISVKTNSLRLRCLADNQQCVWCGRKGKIFLLQTSNQELEAPHLNLYHRAHNGKMILMTRDHVIPTSRGGQDHLDNLATMCETCNLAKKNLLPLDFVLGTMGWYQSQRDQKKKLTPEYQSQAEQWRQKNLAQLGGTNEHS